MDRENIDRENMESARIHTEHMGRLIRLEQEQTHNATKADLMGVQKELIKLETELSHSASKEDLEHLEHAMSEKHEVLSNGQSQLKTKMDNLSGSISTSKWVIGFALACLGIIAPIIAVLISHALINGG